MHSATARQTDHPGLASRGAATPPFQGGEFPGHQRINLNSLSIIEQAVFTRVITLTRSRPGCSVLEAPCGEGMLSLALQEKGINLSAVDIDESAGTHLGAAFQKTDLNTKLPFPDRTFDIVVSVEGIEHLENPHSFLRELNRVLKDDGRLILTTPNIVSLRSRVRFLGSGFFHRDSMPLNETKRHGLHHIGLRSFPQLRYDLHTLGFHIDEVAATHTKPVSYLYAMFIPWMFLYTLIAFRKEKDRIQKKRNREILRTLYSGALMFGENLLLVARKVS
jgi:SAM-dependent methyltransferase